MCFNPEVAKKLPHKPLFKKKIVAGQPLHPEEKQRVFQLASNPDNFYPVVVSLQVSPSPSAAGTCPHFRPTSSTWVERETVLVISSSTLLYKEVRSPVLSKVTFPCPYPTGLPSLPLLLALLKHFKAGINARDGNGLTPLNLACRLGHLRVAEVCGVCDCSGQSHHYLL